MLGWDPASKLGFPGAMVFSNVNGVALADSRGITCATIDLQVLRGEREPDLTLFAA